MTISSIARAAQVLEAQAAVKSYPKPGRKARKSRIMPRRRMVEKQLEDIVKMIIFWRDAQDCVQQKSDGARCGNGLAWGHYVAQGQSNWLRYELGNVYVQCGNHNLLDHNGDKSYTVWFVGVFGGGAAKALDEVRAAHRGRKNRTVQELEDLLAHYTDLYQNRFFVKPDLKALVQAGYYGEIIKNAWMLDGRL